MTPLARAYLPSMSIEEYERSFSERFPEMQPTLWLDRPGRDQALSPFFDEPNEFETNSAGRGDSYRRAHQQGSVKSVGVTQLLKLATGLETIADTPPDFFLLDILGGDGTVARAANQIPQWNSTRKWILTGDQSAQMVEKALAYDLPAVRLAAQFLLCRDEAFASVLLAYGSHHIPPEERVSTYADCRRTLRSGGRLVVHDFAVGSPTANWFETVVDSYSPTGHDYIHFTPHSLANDLTAAGFGHVETKTIYDPIVVRAHDATSARVGILSYLLDSYGLAPLTQGDMHYPEQAIEWVAEQVAKCIHYDDAQLKAFGDIVPPAVRELGTVAVYPADGGWIGELPRTALVGVGQK